MRSSFKLLESLARQVMIHRETETRRMDNDNLKDQCRFKRVLPAAQFEHLIQCMLPANSQ